MRANLRQNIFYILLICTGLIGLELITDWRFLVLFLLGLSSLAASLFISKKWLSHVLLTLGLVLVLMTVLLTRSFWLLTLSVFVLFYSFKNQTGNELGHVSEAILHPSEEKLGDYYGIQLVQPQSQQRTILHHQSLFDQRDQSQQHKTTYEWDDINLVYLGGNTIVDLGNTVIPAGEHIVMVRKVFGRLRLIIPRDIGLGLNISLVSGQVVFENQTYPLTLENFTWRTPSYAEANRKLKLIVSSVIGDVEVIIL